MNYKKNYIFLQQYNILGNENQHVILLLFQLEKLRKIKNN
jgi:hypothetical protein